MSNKGQNKEFHQRLSNNFFKSIIFGEVNMISITQIYNSNMHFFPGEYTW